LILAASKLTWYVARSGGIIAWGLLTLSVMWGLVLSSKAIRKTPTPAWSLDFHRFLGAFSLTFVAIHLAGL